MEKTPKEEEILKEYNQADNAGKALLERMYGKKTFLPEFNYKNLKTLEDCCKKENYNPTDLKVILPAQLSEFQECMQGHLEALIEQKAVSNGYRHNTDKKNWWPYFNMPDKNGVGFSFDDSFFGYSFTYIGSRLVFEEKEQSDYFATQFLPTHKKRLLQ